MHRHLSPEIYRWKIHDTHTGGVPDAYYCGPGDSLWIEYKYIKLPKRASTLVQLNLSELQKIWLTRAYEWRQSVAIVVGYEKKLATVITNPNLIGKITKTTLQEEAISFKAVAAWIENTVSSCQGIEQCYDKQAPSFSCKKFKNYMAKKATAI